MNVPAREETLFAEALHHPPDQRAAFLDQFTRDDPGLRQRVEALLSSYEMGEFLERAAASESRPTSRGDIPLSERPGDRIGHYKLLEQIGEGGGGVVYVAEQSEPVRRRVALKIIKLGTDTRSVIARFEAERQALAMMDHPNIARVFDAGATETGRPYFVMELVRGRKITDYCDEAKLSTENRLDLFIQVCQAIQHAHQKGIIHRDIKPSNILVTVNDGVPVPKVIDFGIAKATSGQVLTDKTIYTAFEQFIGTPAYMSPEQAMLTSLDIDTRSDIYALGVLLYELLTGRTPFDTKELLAIGLDELRRTLLERDPQRPSTRVSLLPSQELSTTAQRRGLDAPRLVSELRGDLDWIVMKALEKDRARRYETANGLAADVQRHLNNEPVVACPPSRLYRFRKMVRRNRLVFAAGATVAASLAVGLIFSMILLSRERAARQRADRQETKAREQTAVAQAVSDFLQEDLLRQVGGLSQANAGFTPNPNLTVREAVERAGERIETRFQDHPLQEAAVRHAIGLALMGVGEYERAIPHAQRAWDLRRERLGPDDRLTLQSMGLVGRANASAGRLEQSLQLLEELRRRSQATLGETDPDTLEAMARLAWAYSASRRFQDAVALGEEVLRRRETALGPGHRDSLESMENLAWAYAQAGMLPQAKLLAEKACARTEAALPPSHPKVVDMRMTLAGIHLLSGQFQDAVSLYRENHERYLKLLGPDHPSTLWSAHNLAVAYLRADSPDPVLPLAEETLKRRRAKLGSDHPDTLSSLDLMADAHRAAGRMDQVETVLRERLELTQARFGPLHPDTFKILWNLVMTYKATGQSEKAVPLLQESLRIRKSRLGESHIDTLKAQALLGMAYQNSRQSAEAIELMQETVRLMKLHLGPDHRETLGAMNNLAKFHEETGKPEAARQLYEQTFERMRVALSPDDEFRLIVMKNLADAYDAAGQLERALPLYEDRLARLRAKFRPDASQTMDAIDDLRSAYQAAGKHALSLPLAEATVAHRKEKLGLRHRLTLGAMCNLAIDYRETGDNEKALSLFEETLALMRLHLEKGDPFLRITMDNLVSTYQRAGKSGDALKLCEENLELRRTLLGLDHPETLNAMNGLAAQLAGMKEHGRALSVLRAAAAKGNAEAMNTLAWVLATANDDALRNGGEAVDLAQRAFAKAGGNSWSHLDTLAAAQAEVGEFAKAADSQRQAIGACQDEQIKTHLTARLKLYESGTPFREPW